MLRLTRLSLSAVVSASGHGISTAPNYLEK